MNELLRRLMLCLAADGGGEGGGGDPPPAADPPAAAPPAGGDPPAGAEAGPEEAGDEWQGWWAGQLAKETREKHRDGLLALKGKQLGEVFDEYFDSGRKLKDAVVFPAKDAPKEEVEAFLKRMDIPLSEDGYGLDPKLLPPSWEKSDRDNAAKVLAQVFRKNGLTKAQGGAMFAAFSGFEQSRVKRLAGGMKYMADSFEERLLKDSGGDGKAAAETKEWFKRSMIALGDKGLAKELADSGMLYSTALVRAFADIWKAGNTDAPLPRGAQGGSGAPAKDALPKGDEFNRAYGHRRV
jgi:hypothetical protein